MKKWIWIVLAILVIGGFFFYSSYNRLVSREEAVNGAWPTSRRSISAARTSFPIW